MSIAVVLSTVALAQFRPPGRYVVPEKQTAAHRDLAEVISLAKEVPYPLTHGDTMLVFEGNDGSLKVSLGSKGPERPGVYRDPMTPHFGADLTEYMTGDEAKFAVLDMRGSMDGGDSLVTDKLFGTVCVREKDEIMREQRQSSPDYWGGMVKFARGRYMVRCNYGYRAPIGPLPDGVVWLGGDFHKEVFRLIRIIDNRVAARIASEVAAGKRRRK
jgi:hypothetical protein